MKKHAFLVILLTSSFSLFAQDIKDNSNLSQTTVNCEPTPTTLKKPKFNKTKKKKITLLKTQDIIVKHVSPKETPTPPPESYLKNQEQFHIPNNAEIYQKDIQKFSTPIKYNDIMYSFYIQNEKMVLELKDKRTDKHLDKYYLDEDTAQFEVYSLNSTLKKINKESIINYNTNRIISNIDYENPCSLFIIKYKLKTESNPHFYSYILANGEFHNSLQRNCLNPTLSLSNGIDIDDNFNLTNISINNNDLSNQKIGFNIHFYEDGKSSNVSELSAFAIKKDYSEIYDIKESHNNNIITGKNYVAKVTPGEYYLSISYKINNEPHNETKMLIVK